ncbi:hypothetical protein MN116_000477 [Schistosoma mekongi]|uniref:PI3K-RBD domain-containing protein n=1 Tax=Schistosoma mekongi TaxID=38744 RepID=A0AAE2D5P6_SCHME|nr:hypothetical protein MN116_000477 [Schistosoma mekongi]
MSNSQNETAKLKDLIDFECDVNSSAHKFSEIQLLFDPLIPTSVNSDISSKNNLISLSSFVEPLNTLSECNIENDSPFDLISNYSTGSSIKQQTVKPVESDISYALKDAYSVLKRNKSDLSSETLHPPLVDVNGNACLNDQTANISTENVELKEYQQYLPIFLHTISPLCLRRSDRNVTNTITTSQNQQSPTVPLIHFIGNSQPTDELKLFVNFVQSLRRKKYNKTKTSTLINDLDSDTEQNSNNSETVYSPPDAWAYDCVYNNECVTNTMLKASQTSVNNLLSSTFNSSVYQDSNPLWKTETSAFNVSYVYPKSKDYSICQENASTHSVNAPRWCIPQLEVRITAHLNGRRKSSQSFTTSNNFISMNSEIINNNPINPRLRLVCDPTTTLVNELMLEALANDLIPHEVILDVNHYQLRLQGRAELLRPDAYLCDCYQVQLCHRLDQPLKLILEPKDVDQPFMKKVCR